MNGSTPMSIIRVIVLAASFVCSVESTRWPVSAALTRDVGRLLVADLADQDDVRVLAQDRAQGPGERQPALGVDRHLVDAVDAVLDRVLDRDDVDVGLRDLVHARVQRRRLARARRTR